MSDGIIFKRLIKNPILHRTQSVIQINHAGSSVKNIDELRKMIAKKHNVKDEKLVMISNMQNRFGGNSTTAFVCIYDNLEALKKIEPKYRQIRAQLIEKPKAKTARKAVKSAKNKDKKKFGTHQKAKGKK